MAVTAPIPPEPVETARRVIDACRAMGFARAGIARAEPTSFAAEYRAWIAAGRHGDMDYLAENIDERLDIRKLQPGARSVVMVADQYAAGSSKGVAETANDSVGGGADERAGRPLGMVAKYARGRDYHHHIRGRLHKLADRLRKLFPGTHCRTFIDTAPVLEREQAARALLGAERGPPAFIGKHTLLIDPRLGSYLLLGGLATTLELAPTRELPAQRQGARIAGRNDGCGNCTRCIDACPTKAIAPYSVDATRCISYLTLEHKGEIASGLQAAMGSWLLGCDICQDVCPFNAGRHPNDEPSQVRPEYRDDGARASLPLLEVLGWSEDVRRRVLSGSAAKRATLEMIRRNALIAMGNQREGATLALPVIQAIANRGAESPIVRGTARAVLERLATTC